MKKLIAAALTGALVLGTVGTSVVFAADDDKTITVAASETPHSEILEAAKPILEEEGYDLEVTVFAATVMVLSSSAAKTTDVPTVPSTNAPVSAAAINFFIIKFLLFF